MTEELDGCVKPSKGPIAVEQIFSENASGNGRQIQEVPKLTARVGKPAPDFELSAYMNGGFKNVRLSDYKGKWIVVCFYPGDFTFV
jgi:peroxiredoxin (alkyl hydroperoxide reductase subunit C)